MVLATAAVADSLLLRIIEDFRSGTMGGEGVSGGASTVVAVVVAKEGLPTGGIGLLFGVDVLLDFRLMTNLGESQIRLPFLAIELFTASPSPSSAALTPDSADVGGAN